MLEKYSARTRRQALLAIAVVAAAALLGAAFVLSSYMRGSTAERAAAATKAGGISARPPASSRQVAVPQPSPKPVAPLAASLRAFGLGAPSVPRVAEDFSLGPLQSYRPAEGDESSVFAVVKAFMDGIAAGKLDNGLLLPEARDALSLLLAPPEPAATAPAVSRDAPSYRLGAISIRGQDASLLVRLPAAGLPSDAAVREEGLLSLRKVGDAWYVEALALDSPKTGALAFAPDAADRAK
jgi:hypothetical protein